MQQHNLSQLIDIEKLHEVLGDIYAITGIPTGIYDTITRKNTIKNKLCSDDISNCKNIKQKIFNSLKEGKKYALETCNDSNILGVPIKMENRIIAVLYHCQFCLSEDHQQAKSKNGITIKEEQLETNANFLVHFAEFISITCSSRYKELEVNSKLDLMIQRETVELLKTNAELENEIKERKLTEIKLTESEERFRSIFEQSSIGIMTFTTEQKLINCNLAINEMLGFTPEKIRDKKLNDLLVQDDIQLVESHIKNLIKRKTYNFYLESRFLKNDNSILWGKITVSFISREITDSPDFILVMMEDVTARKLAEKELMESEERFRSLFENAPEAVYLFNPENHKILLANKFTKDFFGYDANELEEMSIFDLIASDNSVINDKINEVLNEEKTYFEESKYRKKDGTLVDVGVIATKNYYKGENCILAFVRDITERKRYETEIKKALERERELNQLKSNFVSTVSHEFKTPMAIIVSSVQLLERFSGKWDEAKKSKLYQKIYKAVMVTNGLINNVLLIGKDQSGKLEFKPSLAHFEGFCRQIVEETSIIFGADVSINTKIETSFGKINIDTNLLRHIFTNLISNAVKYSPDNKSIEFRTFHNPKAPETINISIKDNGIGIAKQDLKNIFEPFHRANNVAQIQGTGLGMSIVKRCVDLHKGSINILSEIGKGTTVNISVKIEE